MKLIDKDALVAEIKRKKKSASPAHFCKETYEDGYYRGLNEALFTIKSLEVKEVDLDVMQRMEECPFRKVGCEIYEGHILECEGTCGWIVDHLKLKELKAQKGE